MNIVEVYDRLNKTMLIKSYRRYLEENEKFSTKKKKEGKYPHPIVNGKQLSWTQFGKLPRDAILVFILTDGCDLEYLTNLNAINFYTERREWHPLYGMNPWDGEEE
tara:strand:+ start:1266 stop:1583 length:318 start_codon:yes stop_codon:yes gene_type:complete